jgi:N-methylhydantoinase B
MKAKLWNNSGGAGKFRGGLGLEKVFEVARGEATITYRGERHSLPPWGLFGGRPGKQSRAQVTRNGGGEAEEVASKATLKLHQGDRLHVFTAGGAGYGDPLDRDPGLILQDVLDGRVSVKSALDDYGLVLKAGSGGIDFGETERVRARLKEDRGPLNWTYDLGPELGRM